MTGWKGWRRSRSGWWGGLGDVMEPMSRLITARGPERHANPAHTHTQRYTKTLSLRQSHTHTNTQTHTHIQSVLTPYPLTSLGSPCPDKTHIMISPAAGLHPAAPLGGSLYRPAPPVRPQFWWKERCQVIVVRIPGTGARSSQILNSRVQFSHRKLASQIFYVTFTKKVSIIIWMFHK